VLSTYRASSKVALKERRLSSANIILDTPGAFLGTLIGVVFFLHSLLSSGYLLVLHWQRGKYRGLVGLLVSNPSKGRKVRDSGRWFSQPSKHRSSPNWSKFHWNPSLTWPSLDSPSPTIAHHDM
jgi:hypothetical protein